MPQKRRLDRKKLNNLLANKSASIVPAESTRLLQSQSSKFAGIIKIGSGFVSNSKNSKIDRLVIFLLMSYGLRIAEVLRISGSDISPDGMILIQPAKGSQPRFCSSGPFQSWLSGNRVHFAAVLSGRSYDYYYRLFIRLGISSEISGNIKCAVTHVFRYAFIERLNALSGNIEDTGYIVGHKRKSNTKRYVKKIKEKN